MPLLKLGSASVYVGHSFQTDRFEEKQRRVTNFLRFMPREEQIAFLDSAGARFVLIGPLERLLAGGREFSLWPVVYEAHGYRLHERPNVPNSA